jgi:hypothetical protein
MKIIRDRVLLKLTLETDKLLYRAAAKEGSRNPNLWNEQSGNELKDLAANNDIKKLISASSRSTTPRHSS